MNDDVTDEVASLKYELQRAKEAGWSGAARVVPGGKATPMRERWLVVGGGGAVLVVVEEEGLFKASYQ
jgi:hypothetical protein